MNPSEGVGLEGMRGVGAAAVSSGGCLLARERTGAGGCVRLSAEAEAEEHASGSAASQSCS